MLESQVVDSEHNITSTSITVTNVIENEKKDEKINNSESKNLNNQIELSFASFYYSLKVSKGKGKFISYYAF